MKNRVKQKVKQAVAILKKEIHPLCQKDDKGNCEYFTTVECKECKFNGIGKGGKDPRANCNKLIK